MTAAHDRRIEALKEAAHLRSLADAVASPVVAGRKSRKALTSKQKADWAVITNTVVSFNSPMLAELPAKTIAEAWRRECAFAGIGYKRLPVVGWMIPIPGFWGLMFQLLLELAKLWIESRNQGRISDR